MAYREKMAWLTLSALLIGFVPLFICIEVGVFDVTELPNTDLLVAFAMAALVDAAIVGVGYLVLRRRSPDDARVPSDERDRSIEQRSTHGAYYTLLVGTIVVGVVMPLDQSGWEIIVAALGALFLAEVVHHGLVIIGYRRAG